jgi:hypothetical protein
MGHINHLCGETPTKLRTGIPAPTTNFASLTVTLTETQHKIAITLATNQVVQHVNLKTSSRRSLNASLCSGSTPTRAMILCGLRLSAHDDM